MIISQARKFAFFRVPKTGSTTAEFLLRMSQAFDPAEDLMTGIYGLPSTLPESANVAIHQRLEEIFSELPEDKVRSGFEVLSVHLTPQDAIDFGLITLEQLREYSCYAFLRDPYERAISAHKHSLGSRFVLPEFFQKTIDEANKLKASEKILLWKPQSDYFYIEDEQVVTPLSFDDYEAEIRKLITSLGGVNFIELPRLNRGKELVGDTSIFDDESAKEKIESVYAEDKSLYDQMRST